MTTATRIEFSRRAKITTTAAARLRRWRCRSAPLAVVEVQSLFGLPTRYLVVRRLPNGNKRVVSKHRKQAPALRAGRRLAQKLTTSV